MTTSPDDRAAPPEELKQQAWDWLRLLNSGTASKEDADGFRCWVQSSPAHQATYNEVKRRWDAFRQPAGAVLRTNPAVAAYDGYAQRGVRRSRRTFLGAATSVTVVAGLAIAYPPLGLWAAPAEWRADYRTAVGEQRTLALADRVDVTLNTRTSVRRQMAGGQTVGLDLITGEAAIDLRGVGHSFTVMAGAGRSVAESGQFEVRFLEGKVCVTCLGGAVRVEHPTGIRTLQARQQAVYDIGSLSGVAGIDPGEVSAWRQGQLVFRQTRLADALDEINRYRSGRVMLMNDTVRNKTVTGHFSIASIDLALTQLQHVFGLTARPLPGGLLVLS